MFKALKIFLFGLVALALLVGGCFGAQVLWQATHHRYDDPNSGYYHASVNAVFFGTDDDVYLFRFRGQSDPRWQWTYSTNFVYRRLQFEWLGFDSQADPLEGSGSLRLPSLAYESSSGTGILTRAVLSGWLLGSTNPAPAAARSVDAVFGFIVDAGRGVLPAPRHHGHDFEQTVRGQMQHFRSGLGVGGLVYFWIAAWVFLIVFFGRRLWRRHGGA